MNLPASPAARRREEEVRIRQRLEAMDSKLDACLGTIGGAQPGGAKAPPPSPAVQDLARAIGQDRIFLPTAVLINRRLNDDGEEEATSIRVGHLTFTVQEAVNLGVLTLEGRFSHYRAGVLLHSTPEPGAWARPHWEAEIPGRPRA
jgi:hypothetical protein